MMPIVLPPPAIIARIANVDVTRLGDVLHFTAGLHVDADGAPRAYHPDDHSGLDKLANGRASIVRDGGTPIIQGSHDPAPGYFVSATSLADRSYREGMQRRYVDASRVPYVALPPQLVATRLHPEHPVHVGDLAWVRCGARESWAIVADVGPADAIGEGSIALAEALAIPASPRRGGCDGGVEYWIFVNSFCRPVRWPRDDGANAARRLAESMGILTR